MAKMVSCFVVKHTGLCFVVCLAIFLTSQDGGAAIQRALRPKQQQNTSVSNTKWEHVSYRGQSIVAVGSTRLQYPVVLPPHIKPLNDVGLFVRISATAYDVSFFFPKEQEAPFHRWYLAKQVRRWIQVPKTNGVPKYRFSQPKANMWDAAVEGATNGWRWWLVASGNPYDPNEDLNDYRYDALVFQVMRALRERASPVKRASRLVSLTATFRVLK